MKAPYLTCLLPLLAVPAATAELISSTTLALSGTTGPLETATFRNFADATIDDSGLAVFRANYNGFADNDSYLSLWSWTQGAGLDRILRQGQQIPGLASGTLSPYIDPGFRSTWDSQAGFLGAQLRTSTSGGLGMGALGGTPDAFANYQIGSPTGFPSTVGFAFGFIGPVRVGDAGRVTFVADTGRLFNPNAGASAGYGIWQSTTPGDLTLVIRSGGAAAPGIPGATISSLGWNYDVNASGKVVVNATTTQGRALYAGTAGNMAPVVREGVTQVAGRTVSFIGANRVADDGQVFFDGLDSESKTFLATGDAGNWTLLARQGDGIAGGPLGATIASLGYSGSLIDVGAAGRALLGVNLQVGFQSVPALLRASPGELAAIAYGGMAVPGVAGATFPNLTTFAGAMTDSGIVAFHAVYGSNRHGLWYGEPGNLTLAVGTGDQLEVSPSLFKTIATIQFRNAYATSDESGLNDLGQLVFQATFTDGTQGVFLLGALIPEPSAIASVFGILALLAAWRSRSWRS